MKRSLRFIPQRYDNDLFEGGIQHKDRCQCIFVKNPDNALDFLLQAKATANTGT